MVPQKWIVFLAFLVLLNFMEEIKLTMAYRGG